MTATTVASITVAKTVAPYFQLQQWHYSHILATTVYTNTLAGTAQG